MSLWSKFIAIPGEAWEKIASIPPLYVFITSLLGVINWQTIFYIVSTVWVLVQLYFRLRKERAKWKAKQILDPEDTDYRTPT